MVRPQAKGRPGVSAAAGDCTETRPGRADTMIAAAQTADRLPPTPPLLLPIGWIGRSLLGITGYCGGVGLAGLSAARAVLRPARTATPIRPAVANQLEGLLGMAAAPVALVHMALGSTLAMQAYYGGTFAEGTGAVVGVGLVRSIGSVITGMTLAGLLAARIVPEFRGRCDVDASDPRGGEAGRLVAARVIAATVAGPILTLWGALIGTMIGWSVARSYIGVTSPEFFGMFSAMLWARDVVGLFLNSSAYACVSALICCHEGLRPRATGVEDSGLALARLRSAACRAASLSALAILVLNSAWFLLAYHAGPAFGPTVLAAPGR